MIRNSTGSYSVNFSSLLVDGNYAVTTSLSNGYNGVSAVNRVVQVDSSMGAPPVHGFRLQAALNWFTGSFVEDYPYIYAVVIR